MQSSRRTELQFCLWFKLGLGPDYRTIFRSWSLHILAITCIGNFDSQEIWIIQNLMFVGNIRPDQNMDFHQFEGPVKFTGYLGQVLGTICLKKAFAPFLSKKIFFFLKKKVFTPFFYFFPKQPYIELCKITLCSC